MGQLVLLESLFEISILFKKMRIVLDGVLVDGVELESEARLLKRLGQVSMPLQLDGVPAVDVGVIGMGGNCTQGLGLTRRPIPISIKDCVCEGHVRIGGPLIDTESLFCRCCNAGKCVEGSYLSVELEHDEGLGYPTIGSGIVGLDGRRPLKVTESCVTVAILVALIKAVCPFRYSS